MKKKNPISHSDKFLIHCWNRIVSDMILLLSLKMPLLEPVYLDNVHLDLFFKFQFNSQAYVLVLWATKDNV